MAFRVKINKNEVSKVNFVFIVIELKS